MFKNILIPISSEYYSKEVLERSVFLAEKFKSTINLIYIIEEKTLNQTDKKSDSYRTPYEIAETKNEIRQKQKQTADQIVFEDAKYYFKNKGIPLDGKIIEGEFSNIIKREIDLNDYDLVLMGFEKECALNYRLFDDIKIPLWVVNKNDGKSILAVCSNIAPNVKVPDLSLKLKKILNLDLNMIYVVDINDTVQVDQNAKRSPKKTENDLMISAENFKKQMEKKDINIELLKGGFEKEVIKATEVFDPKIVIIGREQKKKGILGLPVKNLKKKLVEKCKYSILFLN
jgi:nucleotide-binding universal stress UspA family protein